MSNLKNKSEFSLASAEFIILELKNFIKSFPKTRVRIENDIESYTHFVEVVPNEVYHLDKKYIEWECNFLEKFTSIFPEQNICFISDDAIIRLGKIDFELIGGEYSEVYLISNIV